VKMLLSVLLTVAIGSVVGSTVNAQTSTTDAPGGFPAQEEIQRAYEEADLNRAIEAYKFFYPNVSIAGLFAGFDKVGFKDNQDFFILEGQPQHVLFTPNSDTPYAVIPLNLSSAPMVVELPEGPLLGVANDLNFRWVIDMGLPGPDAGKGGKHMIVGPEYKGELPAGYFEGHATTNRVFLIVRSLPLGGDLAGATERIKTVKIYPLGAPDASSRVTWKNITAESFNATPLQWEQGLEFWRQLHRIIDTEPVYKPYRIQYGQLAVLGIVKGKPFSPDDRMKAILERAAKAANGQMRVQSMADRRTDRIVWKDRKTWEWATLRPENGTFDTPTYKDLDAREKWFWQATFESPAMFRRKAGGGSVYWLGARDNTGTYLDGSKHYKLSIPTPVPAKLFWSVTVYDPETRSEIQTDQDKAALRSLFELKGKDANASSIDLYFGPTAPKGMEGQWIKTKVGQGWFVYLRLYGPEQLAFDGTWRPGDFELMEQTPR